MQVFSCRFCGAGLRSEWFDDDGHHWKFACGTVESNCGAVWSQLRSDYCRGVAA